MAVVALLGDINVDLVLDVETYPPEGGEAIASSQAITLGGSATNTAIALARSGHEARLIGRVGNDDMGRRARSQLETAGVVTRWIGTDDIEPTQTNVIAVSTSGERTMFAYRGANARLSVEMIDEQAFSSAQMFHLSGYALLGQPQLDAAKRAIAIAIAREIPVSLDLPGGIVPRIAETVKELLPSIDTVMLACIDLPELLGDDDGGECHLTARKLLDHGVRRIALKGDHRGSALLETDATHCAQRFDVDVEDTTGAGDAFAAGHIHGRLSDFGGRDCCSLANALGALAITRKGAGLAMPGVREAFDLINSR